MLRSGIVPTIDHDIHDDATAAYIAGLADEVLGTTEVVDRIVPTTDEINAFARQQEIDAKGLGDSPIWVTQSMD